MSINKNLEFLLKDIPDHIRLIAVTKTKPVSDIKELYNAGHRICGENKAQDLAAKKPELPDDIEWHFIGHLQTNKVKYIAPFVSVIHSIDSLKLLAEINKQALKNERIIDCLLQFHIATEESKFGLDKTEAREMLQSDNFVNLKNIKVTGVMGMATFTENESVIREEFRYLKQIFSELKSEFFSGSSSFSEISMGMSADYKIAIEEGSTMVRIGTAIFGPRF